MTVTINGQTDTINGDKVSVLELLSIKDVEMPDMVSVQLNGDILDREKFESTYVQENDEVEFLYFMGGGGV
jgi:sulfur carrier protein